MRRARAITGLVASAIALLTMNAAVAQDATAQETPPPRAQAYVERCSAYINNMGDGDRALAEYNHAIQLDPKYAMADVGRGGVYLNKGDNDRAIAAFTQAIQLDPKYSQAYNARGEVYLTKGDNDRAIADFTQAIQLDPNFEQAYINRANAYSKKGETDRATADYNQGLRRMVMPLLNSNPTPSPNSSVTPAPTHRP